MSTMLCSFPYMGEVLNLLAVGIFQKLMEPIYTACITTDHVASCIITLDCKETWLGHCKARNTKGEDLI